MLDETGGEERVPLPQLGRDLLGVVACHRQAAAFGGALGAEGRQDHVALRPQGALERGEVAGASGGVDHEVKEGAVVPEVEPATEVVVPYVGFGPAHAARGRAEVGPGALQGGGGDVGDGDIGIAPAQQLGGQPRGASADVDDPGIQRHGCLRDQRQRNLGQLLGPAQLLDSPLDIGPLPVSGAAVIHSPDCDAKRPAIGA